METFLFGICDSSIADGRRPSPTVTDHMGTRLNWAFDSRHSRWSLVDYAIRSRDLWPPSLFSVDLCTLALYRWPLTPLVNHLGSRSRIWTSKLLTLCSGGPISDDVPRNLWVRTAISKVLPDSYICHIPKPRLSLRSPISNRSNRPLASQFLVPLPPWPFVGYLCYSIGKIKNEWMKDRKFHRMCKIERLNWKIVWSVLELRRIHPKSRFL